MNETCKSCGTVFDLDENILSDKIHWLKCSVCNEKWSVSLKKNRIISEEKIEKTSINNLHNDEINKVIEKSGEVKNNASPILKQIRKDINHVRGKIGASFNSALSKSIGAGYLDDIKETVMDNQRVLAVKAMYRKKVAGSLLGSSKSGGIVYIAPQATLSYSREYQNLVYDEKQELVKILRELSSTIRPMAYLLEQYLEYLVHIDSVGAKAKYAREINAVEIIDMIKT